MCCVAVTRCRRRRASWLHQALIRIAAERIPKFAHSQRLEAPHFSKRDPQSNLFAHCDRGFIPEGLVELPRVARWSIADDHDLFN